MPDLGNKHDITWPLPRSSGRCCSLDDVIGGVAISCKKPTISFSEHDAYHASARMLLQQRLPIL